MKLSTSQLFNCFILSLLFIAFNFAPVVIAVCCYPKRLWSTCPDVGDSDPNTYYCNDCEVGTPYCGRMDCNIFGRLFLLLIKKQNLLTNRNFSFFTKNMLQLFLWLPAMVVSDTNYKTVKNYVCFLIFLNKIICIIVSVLKFNSKLRAQCTIMP